MLKLFISDTDYTLDANLDTITAIIGLNRATSSAGLETSGLGVKVQGAAASFLKATYVDQCVFPPIVLDVKIITDCGTFLFKISPKDVSWCTDCTAEIDLDSATEEGVCYNRLDNEPLVNDSFWQYLIDTKKWDVTPYQRDVTVFTMILAKTVNHLTVIPQLLLPKSLRSRLKWGLFGSGRWHASFNVLDTLKYYANRCDRTFRSSILESDPYSKLSLLPAPSAKGGWWDEQAVPIVEAFDIYTPTWSVKDLMDNLGKLFWAEWRISRTEIIIEQKDYFINNALNLGELKALNDYCVLPYVHNCKSRSFEYTRDALDDAGDSDMSLYNHYHDFDFDNIALTEACKNVSDSSIAVNSASKGVGGLVKRLRGPGLNQLGEFIVFSHLGMLLSKHRSSQPKFFIADHIFNNPGGHRIVIQDQVSTGGSGLLAVAESLANPDLSFDPDRAGNLYERFHFKQDPANEFLPCQTVASIEVCFDCDLLNTMRDAFADGRTVYFTSVYGNMYFTESDVQLGENESITISNVEIYANS